jgi:hypothetical protein
MALSKEQIQFLKDTYTHYMDLGSHNGDIAKMTLESFFEKFEFEISSSTLHKTLKKSGIACNYRGKRKGFTDEEYYNIFLKYDGDIDKIIEETGYQRNSVKTRLRILGLIPGGQRHNRDSGRSKRPTEGKYLTAFLIEDNL